ncbi:MAG: ABC transporter substrate-binding protein [Tissierellales bacterium]|nr:ABC transporter substrate-binding protein [Tissierellales bacterium]MBN2826512.1 ABC transporter substrate-binding protein [Tissierellales bacterium]
MKKIIVFFTILVMVLAMFSGCSTQKAESNVITIGVFEPSSGDNGAGGKQEVLGIEYAHSKVNTVEIDGKTYTIKLEIVDNESSTDKAPTAAQTLVSAKSSVVLGSYGSGVSIAASDVFKNANIPVIGVSCTNPQVTEGNTHYFRVCYLDPFQGTVLANFAVDQYGAKTAYILTKMGDDYSVGLGKYFKQAFEELGGTVIEETFQEGNSDFTAFLANAVKSEAGVIFAPTSTEAASLIIGQASSQGITIPLLAGDTWDSSVILDAASGSNLSVAVSTFFDEGDNSTSGAEFVSGFKAWLNSDNTKLANNGGNDIVAAVSALGYDAYMVAIEAIKAAGSADSVKINESLWNINYLGVTGNIAFDQTGDAIRDVAYIKSVNTSEKAWQFEAIQSIK